MNTSEQLVVNKLPTRTWNHLNVNEATIPWNVAETADLGTDAYEITAENQAQPLHIRLTGAEGCSRKHIAVDVAAGVQATVYMVLDAQGSFAVETALTLHDRASLRLVQVLGAQVGALLYAKTNADCAPDAGVAMTQILMGRGDLYSDNDTELVGDGSHYSAQIGYLGRGSQTIDVNVVVNHYGKNTECEIDTSGALKDAAKKVFRGTIDFKTGSLNSVGNEKETVLMLGDDVVNKTVPLILCDPGPRIDRALCAHGGRRSAARADSSDAGGGTQRWRIIISRIFRSFSIRTSPISTTQPRPSAHSVCSMQWRISTAATTQTLCAACIL